MNNLVSLNNNIFHHIVRSVLVTLHAHGITRELVLYLTKKHCFQSYNQGYGKTNNN